jgi:hypothetical protein
MSTIANVDIVLHQRKSTNYANQTEVKLTPIIMWLDLPINLTLAFAS